MSIASVLNMRYHSVNYAIAWTTCNWRGPLGSIRNPITFTLLIQKLVTRDYHMTRAAGSGASRGESLLGHLNSLGVVYL